MTKQAYCDDCGWRGPASDLRPGPNPLDEICPECGSDSTWWGDPDEPALTIKNVFEDDE